MTPKKVWVKLRDSRSEVFKVEVDERADFDDLKKAIKQRKAVRVASIFTEEYEEGSKCEPADLISSHGSVGRADTPFYFTIAPPGMYFSASDKKPPDCLSHCPYIMQWDRRQPLLWRRVSVVSWGATFL
jgi:hypothetical protein